jgi:hypothetical protein
MHAQAFDQQAADQGGHVGTRDAATAEAGADAQVPGAVAVGQPDGRMMVESSSRPRTAASASLLSRR